MSESGKTVLLVEDNEDNRIVYSTILKHFGYDVTEALNGEEGIAKARAEKPDLILMDISIPIIDGSDATVISRSLASRARWWRKSSASLARAMEREGKYRILVVDDHPDNVELLR